MMLTAIVRLCSLSQLRLKICRKIGMKKKAVTLQRYWWGSSTNCLERISCGTYIFAARYSQQLRNPANPQPRATATQHTAHRTQHTAAHRSTPHA